MRPHFACSAWRNAGTRPAAVRKGFAAQCTYAAQHFRVGHHLAQGGDKNVFHPGGHAGGAEHGVPLQHFVSWYSGFFHRQNNRQSPSAAL
jgi:hypothetical protein